MKRKGGIRYEDVFGHPPRTFREDWDHHPIQDTLQISVWLRIQKFKDCGGPTEADYERARAFAPILAEKADILLFGGGKKDEVAELFNQLADAVAVTAFVPGGVMVFGNKYEEKV